MTPDVKGQNIGYQRSSPNDTNVFQKHGNMDIA